MGIGPDFRERTKQILAKRAGQVCSNPGCRKPTSGAHSDKNNAINLGEAAHIRAARKGQARYDEEMTDPQRSDISNGIWLCKECARKIDLDENEYPIVILDKWKAQHEQWISSGKPLDTGREVLVKNGGIGSVISNQGPGIGMNIEHHGNGPAERIVVEGPGIGEIVTNSGSGTGKKVISTGGGSGSDISVVVDQPVKMAAGLISKCILTNCCSCGQSVSFSKVVQGFAGDNEPLVSVACPVCGATNKI